MPDSAPAEWELVLLDLERDMTPDELAGHRARLARLVRLIEVAGIEVGLEALVNASAMAMRGTYRFVEALDAILDAFEHA